jgi:hypothetical protein
MKRATPSIPPASRDCGCLLQPIRREKPTRHTASFFKASGGTLSPRTLDVQVRAQLQF